ncbi:hypothetical protein [Nocardioides nanhaiensis]|uniref:Uncharacterized protein n=1 Tax=Nocardioides nanhaiensis TaxID=1476871 RepID=A0ABP8VZY3_9ACTN
MQPAAPDRRRRGAVVTALLAAVLLIATSLGLAAETPAGTTLAVVLVSLATLCLAGSRHGVLVVRTATATPTRWGTAPPVLPHRVTAPRVHPRRPRAPGIG